MANAICQRAVTLAVLAGGEGRRMGLPKARLRLGGMPILQFLLQRWKWEGPTLLVTAPGRANPPGCELFTCEVTDPVAGAGPLRGLLTALEHVSTPLLIAATVDMPAVGREQFGWLLSRAWGDASLLGIMADRGVGSEDQVEPFPIAVRPAAAQVIRQRLHQNRRSVRGLLGEPGFLALPVPSHWPPRWWANLNTPEDVRSFACP